MKATHKLFIALCLALIACLAAPAMLPAGLNAAFTARAAEALNKRKATLYTGKTLQLKVTGATKGVKWSSSRPKVAKVNQKGLVTALKAGKATITAKVNGKKLTCAIKVKSSLSVDNASVTLNAGETKIVNLTSRSGGSLSLKAYNSTILECTLGSIRGGKCALAIRGLRAGAETLVVTNTKTGEAVKIKVTVRQNEDPADPIVDKTSVTVGVGKTATINVTWPYEGVPHLWYEWYDVKARVFSFSWGEWNGTGWPVYINGEHKGKGKLWITRGNNSSETPLAEVDVTVK